MGWNLHIEGVHQSVCEHRASCASSGATPRRHGICLGLSSHDGDDFENTVFFFRKGYQVVVFFYGLWTV